MSEVADDRPFESLEPAERVDLVLTVGLVGTGFHFALGLVGEALDLPFLGMGLVRASLGFSIVLFALWTSYRLFLRPTARQTRLSEWENPEEHPP